jgi:hypothetical protein
MSKSALNKAIEALRQAQDNISSHEGKREYNRLWGVYDEAINACKEAEKQEVDIIEQCAKYIDDECFCHDPMGAESLIQAAAGIRALKGKI